MEGQPFLEQEPESTLPKLDLKGELAAEATASEPTEDIALDRVWYERLTAIGQNKSEEEQDQERDTTDYLAGEKEDREAVKQSFLADEVRNPTLRTPFIDIEAIGQQEAELLALKKDIIANETNELVVQVYRWRINEKIASLRMVRAAHEGNMRRFKRYSEFIYGKPSQEIFEYTVGSVRARAEQSLGSDNEDLVLAAQELLASLPEYSKPAETGLPSQETFNYAQEQTKREFHDIIDIPKFKGKLTGEDLRLAFEVALDKLRMSIATGGNWKAVTDTKLGIRTPVTNQQKQEVQTPETIGVSYTLLKELIVHEPGTHGLRRKNGERTKLMLLGIGLDRSEGGEEGVATMRQQVVGKDSLDEFAGLRYHMAAGFALGNDGEPRDFRSVFEIMEKYHVYNYLCRGNDRVKSGRMARNMAYSDCVRLFRGTDCGPGVVFTKDISYRESNMGVWELVGTEEGQKELLRFSVGKYDPTNARHIWILDQLGINEADLIELDNDNT